MLTERPVRVAANPPVDLFLTEAGTPAHATGPPLLAVHGGPDWDHSYLRDPLTRLADQRRVLLPDLRGCGGSTRGLPEGHYTPRAATADLLALLDALGIGEVDVLGFSYGGFLAQRLALDAAAPGRVRHLIVASGTVLPGPPAGRSAGPAQGPPSDGPAEPDPETTRAMAVDQAADDVWRADALPGYLDRLPRVRFSADWLRSWHAGTLPGPRPHDAPARLSTLGVPLLLLHGRHDRTFPAVQAEEAARIIPTARAVVLDDAGHMAHVDQPDRWLAAVHAFLAEPGPPPR